MCVPMTRSDSPIPDSSNVEFRYANMPEYERAASRTISKSGAEKSKWSTGAPGILSKIVTSA